MSDSLLIIFARNPVRGKVKTRLAGTIGPDKALAVYQQLLQKTRDITLPLKVDKVVYFSDKPEQVETWPESAFQQRVQPAGDLGARMAHAFAAAFKEGYRKVGIIGSDCYHLSTDRLRAAFALLDGHDLVLGPATDGGYYFLGLGHFVPDLFQNKTWSTPAVLPDTLADATRLQLQVTLLEELADVDEEKDLAAIPELW